MRIGRLLLLWNWAEFGTEQGQEDVDLVQTQGRLAALQFPDEPQADAVAVGQLRLRESILLALASDILFKIHLRLRSGTNTLILDRYTPEKV